MNYERSVISEARLSSLIALTCAPVILMLVVTIAILNGRSLEESMYHRAFGPVVWIVFYGGLIYSTYEFAKTIFKRKEYLSLLGDSIYTAFHNPIKISEISNICLEKGIITDNIVISKRGGKRTKIRTYLLKDDSSTVLEKLKELT